MNGLKRAKNPPLAISQTICQYLTTAGCPDFPISVTSQIPSFLFAAVQPYFFQHLISTDLPLTLKTHIGLNNLTSSNNKRLYTYIPYSYLFIHHYFFLRKSVHFYLLPPSSFQPSSNTTRCITSYIPFHFPFCSSHLLKVITHGSMNQNQQTHITFYVPVIHILL